MVRGKWLYDYACSLGEMETMLRNHASTLEGMADEGWEVDSTVHGDWVLLSATTKNLVIKDVTADEEEQEREKEDTRAERDYWNHATLRGCDDCLAPDHCYEWDSCIHEDDEAMKEFRQYDLKHYLEALKWEKRVFWGGGEHCLTDVLYCNRQEQLVSPACTLSFVSFVFKC